MTSEPVSSMNLPSLGAFVFERILMRQDEFERYSGKTLVSAYRALREVTPRRKIAVDIQFVEGKFVNPKLYKDGNRLEIRIYPFDTFGAADEFAEKQQQKDPYFHAGLIPVR